MEKSEKHGKRHSDGGTLKTPTDLDCRTSKKGTVSLSNLSLSPVRGSESQSEDQDWLEYLEEKGRQMRIQAMQDLAKRLSGRLDILDQPQRYIVKQGLLKRSGRFRTVSRYCVLFSDMLILTTPPANSYAQITLKQALDLHRVQINAGQNGKNTFTVMTPEREFYMAASSEQEKVEWVTTLTRVITTLQDPLDSAMAHLKGLQQPGNQMLNDQVGAVLVLLAAVKKSSSTVAKAKVRLNEEVTRKMGKHDKEVQKWLAEGFLDTEEDEDQKKSFQRKPASKKPRSSSSHSGKKSLPKRPTQVWTQFLSLLKQDSKGVAVGFNRIMALHREREQFLADSKPLLPTEEEIYEHLVLFKQVRGSKMKPYPRLRYFATGYETELVLNRWFSWRDFDVFRLEDCSVGHPLASLMHHLFEEFGIYDEFPINKVEAARFAFALERGYLDVPYHNRIHAADVLQNIAVMLRTDTLAEQLSPLEKFAALLAAALHDFRHPGTNNAFLCNSNSELAITYNDQSVLENMHLAAAFKVMTLPGHGILNRLPDKQRRQIREIIVQMVLSTDMKKHFTLHQQLDGLVNASEEKAKALIVQKTSSRKSITSLPPSATPTNAQAPAIKLDRAERLLYLQAVLHCADLGNPAKPLNLYLRWTDLIIMEFFAQGDAEAALGLPISPMCDRNKPNKEKSQIGFISVIVAPLFRTVSALIPAMGTMVDQIKDNETYWKRKLAEAEAKTEDAKEEGSATVSTNLQVESQKSVRQEALKGIQDRLSQLTVGPESAEGQVEKKSVSFKEP